MPDPTDPIAAPVPPAISAETHLSKYEPDRPICGARLSHCRQCDHPFPASERELWSCPDCGEDRHCRQRRTYPNGRCKNHGGPTPRGVANPQFKHGLTTEQVVAKHPRLAELYAMYLEDGSVREHTDTIAFFAARIDELIEGSRGAEFYKGIEESFEEFKRANRAKDQAKMRAALDMLERLITQGGKEAGGGGRDTNSTKSWAKPERSRTKERRGKRRLGRWLVSI